MSAISKSQSLFPHVTINTHISFQCNIHCYQTTGSLWSVVTLGMGSSSTPTVPEGTTTPSELTNDLRNRHLSNQSIHLLLILSNHFTNDLHRNPYRLALLHFTDTQGKQIKYKYDYILNWFLFFF